MDIMNNINILRNLGLRDVLIFKHQSAMCPCQNCKTSYEYIWLDTRDRFEILDWQ